MNKSTGNGVSDPSEVRGFLGGDARAIAPLILGAVLTHRSDAGPVSVRLTEVEAYMGPRDSEHPDPGSHTFGGPTARNSPMFGPPGFLYVYFTYGMHYCANIVCGADGAPSALLLRAGEIVEGEELAAVRRPASKAHKDLASGPARLASALGLTTADTGRDALAEPFSLWLPGTPVAAVASGPRVGVAGPGGTTEYPWRFWIEDDPTVSRYKAARPRNRSTAG
ncbi:DNA-3-methyladenine glycosylase [Paenarthrobacter aurescens]|uniref:DNA-3-methyladenine glycosylase n=1 Tax=Paenarthrobacter aurescens TaxID=43663 RepID=UPI0021C1829F|nr:DNA-3-methyladenine glycosylase [Paenarthrobacter aurescens]MCT9871234.1 DNA-3-methyladenine glycosylase [Paenarthrobacter aurescens]